MRYKDLIPESTRDTAFKDIPDLQQYVGKKEIKGSVKCSWRKITSLEGAPEKIVKGDFDCRGNQLTSLKYAPNTVEGDFIADMNPLTSFEHAPEIVDGMIDVDGTNIKSVAGIHHHIKSAKQIQLPDGITEGLLHLFFIKNLEMIVLLGNKEVVRIVNSFLKGEEDQRKYLLPCQQALIKEGFLEYATIPP